MKNIYEILKQFGITIESDKKDDFDKLVTENYKTIKEVEKIQGTGAQLQKDYDTLKSQYDKDIEKRDKDLVKLKESLEKASENNTKLSDITKELEELNTTYSTSKKEYEEKLIKQAYEYAVKDKVNGLKFSSNSAKKAFLNDVLKENLKLDGDVLQGFNDFVDAYKKEDAGAFVTETAVKDDNKPKFSDNTTGNTVDTATKTKETEFPLVL